MRYLITGGAGFIGSHLAEALLAEGHDVSVLDDLSTGRLENLAGFRSHPRLRIVVGSVLNESALDPLVAGADAVFHLAAAVGVARILQSLLDTIETNVDGTERVLQAVARHGKKVLIASTSEVYGKARKVPFTEDDDLVLGPTTRGRWSYACSKALDEFLALAFWREKATPTVVCRFFNTIGPRQTGQYGMVVPRFIDQALAGKPLTVFGDGRQARCFCDVEDVIRALLVLIDLPAAVGEVFNVGNDREITILDLARLIREQTGSQSEIVQVPYNQVYDESFEDMRRRVPSLEKIGRVAGYRPRRSLEETIDRILRSRQAGSTS